MKRRKGHIRRGWWETLGEGRSCHRHRGGLRRNCLHSSSLLRAAVSGILRHNCLVEATCVVCCDDNSLHFSQGLYGTGISALFGWMTSPPTEDGPEDFLCSRPWQMLLKLQGLASGVDLYQHGTPMAGMLALTGALPPWGWLAPMAQGVMGSLWVWPLDSKRGNLKEPNKSAWRL